VGALHGDFRGIGNFRNYADLTNDFPNLHVAGNSASFVDWFSEAYDVKMLLLPDLYSIGPMEHRKPWKHPRVLNVGAFGALRSEKNLPSATAAALIMQRRLNVQVRFHMNQGGERKGGNILATIDQMSQGIPGFDVFKHRWTDWKQFIKLVQGMDLLIQPSYTESFNLVTADGIACGVPTVVSEAIRWAPGSWKADSDDPNDIAEVGLKLLANPEERWEGRRVLIDHNERGLKLWQVFLGVKVKHWWDF
jgi:glycosyltransferase involved in cell wall biosynthesis